MPELASVKKINSLNIRFAKVSLTESGIKLETRGGLFEVPVRIYKPLGRLLRVEYCQHKRSDSGRDGYADYVRTEEVILCIGSDHSRKCDRTSTHHNMNPVPHACPELPGATLILNLLWYGPRYVG